MTRDAEIDSVLSAAKSAEGGVLAAFLAAMEAAITNGLEEAKRLGARNPRIVMTKLFDESGHSVYVVRIEEGSKNGGS